MVWLFIPFESHMALFENGSLSAVPCLLLLCLGWLAIAIYCFELGLLQIMQMYLFAWWPDERIGWPKFLPTGGRSFVA